MFRVLIADDELLSRQALLKVFQTHFPEAQIVGEAQTGRQAVDLYMECLPDLVLLDVKMPGMDGLEAAKAILESDMHANILMLTAHDQFAYIQEALETGVKGYLLKPTMQEDNIEKIRFWLQRIAEQDAVKSRQEKLRFQIDIASSTIEKLLIQSLISLTANEADISSWLNFLDFIPVPGCIWAIKPIFDDLEPGIRNALTKERALDQIQSVIRKFIPESYKCLTAHVGGQYLAVLLSLANAPPEELDSRSQNIAHQMIRRVALITQNQICIGVSPIFSELGEIPDAWRQSIRSVRQDGCVSGVRTWCENPECIAPAGKYPTQLEAELFQCIRTGNSDEVAEKLSNLVETVLDVEELPLRQEFCLQSITGLRRELSVILSNTLLFEEIRLFDGLVKESPEEFEAWYRLVIERFLKEIMKFKSTTGRGLLSQLVALVEDRGYKTMSLNALADATGYSPQYISRVFKEEAGMNYIDFIKGRRIEAAKKLLIETDLSIVLIAQKIGYEDPDYFSRIFRLSTGFSPLQYRHKNFEGGEKK